MSDSTDREKRPGRREDGPRSDGARSASAHPRASKPRQAGGNERKLWTSDGKPARSAAPGARDQQRGGRRDEAPTPEALRARELRAVRPHHDDPEIPDDVSVKELDRVAYNELKTLSKENAEGVAKHLVMVARLIDEDPQLAHRHAISASRRAGRIGMVRETLAITAYATGDYALAIRELRTYRRISGSNEQLALMVDSERGLGRPDRALELGRSVPRDSLSPASQVAVAIAMSGARLDLEQPDLALAELEIPQLDASRAYSYSPDLFWAYAEVLDDMNRSADAATWRAHAERAEAALDASVADDDLIEVFEEEVEMFEEEVESDEESGESVQAPKE
ncbi:hypothetical protein [Subtercola endophyticus]|uniref:hypothetical protein n=1 Tax=Subtercola endophyticus TaxID=2895559 RepID=UPI001E318478|nr:hypothetical protein [Subtercola endophyticus]UFS60699.1 hypothetical protein LQ955_08165 [Subtercola endophyticus]